ncbi:MAG: hypothetical protein BYD32DRAFT_429354 [Podila humilis]|nr:MAG: hypothetical protein BYD32DRAFT_429354 [Podila humilis]
MQRKTSGGRATVPYYRQPVTSHSLPVPLPSCCHDRWQCRKLVLCRPTLLCVLLC